MVLVRCRGRKTRTASASARARELGALRIVCVHVIGGFKRDKISAGFPFEPTHGPAMGVFRPYPTSGDLWPELELDTAYP